MIVLYLHVDQYKYACYTMCRFLFFAYALILRFAAGRKPTNRSIRGGIMNSTTMTNLNSQLQHPHDAPWHTSACVPFFHITAANIFLSTYFSIGMKM